MMVYNKPYLAIPAQLALIKQRGMIITDDTRASVYLERLGYYRLSGYWYPMRDATGVGATLQILDTFRPNTRFEHVADLYVFDKNLRMLMLDAIERVEVALRVAIALQIGQGDPYAHMNKACLHGNFAKKTKFPDGPTDHDDWIERYRRCVRRSHEEFIGHFKSKYLGQGLPIWMAIEVWDFGLMSSLFGGMTYADQTAIANYYGVGRVEMFVSWIKALNEVRNTCAHHSRLWNKPLINTPKPPKHGEIATMDHVVGHRLGTTRVYMAALVLQHMIKTINPTSQWSGRLKALFASFPTAPGIQSSQAGFPTGWEQFPHWN